MITQTTRQIIQRAQQLADLENSAFISHEENVSLLQEAFHYVYNSAINHGDLYFLNLFQTGGNGVYKLPDNFFQVYNVSTDRGQEIDRLPKNYLSSDSGYLIINDKILIQNTFSDVSIQYYINPPTLALADLDKSPIDIPRALDIIPYTYKLIDVCKGYFLYSNGTDYVIINEEGGELYRYTEGGLDGAYLDETKLVLMSSVGDVRNRRAILWQTGELIELGQVGVVKHDNNIDFIHVENNIFVLKDVYGNVLKSNLKAFEIFFNGKGVGSMFNIISCTKDFTKWTIYDNVNKTLDIYKNETFADYRSDMVTTLTLEKQVPQYIDDDLYFAWNEDDFRSTMLYKNFDVLTQVDGYVGMNSAKGFTLSYGTNTTLFYVDGLSELDTILDYPNNLFYTVLSFRLALAYVIKQNGDASMLYEQVQQAETQFFDSISVDENSPVRITNVRGPNYGWI